MLSTNAISFCFVYTSKSFQLNLKFIYNKNNRTMYMDTSKRYFFYSEMVILAKLIYFVG